MQLVAWLAFVLAAIFEVGGDAVIRTGIKANNGIVLFEPWRLKDGLIVNSIEWDFSKIFGVYVGVFALVAVLFSKFLFREHVQPTTWIGLALIVTGGLVIQFGSNR